MGFARTRRAPRLAAALTAVVTMAVVAFAPLAAASPIDDPFVGGFSFAGPTSGDLGAIYWNPAALGLMRGFQVMVSGTARSSSIAVNRAPIDPATGAAGIAASTQPA